MDTWQNLFTLDGQQLDISDFGEFDEDSTTIWKDFKTYLV